MDTLKILVVDDESRMRKLVKDFLTKKNFQVLEAGNGEEAMDIFYEEKDIALIILDVMMPKMDGWEVCREIRKNSKVPIIMLTARSDERDELLGFDLGVDEYISKPFSPKILVARVEAILRRTGQNNPEDVISAGGIVIDKAAHLATVASRPSITGIIISIRITLISPTPDFSNASTASLPFEALIISAPAFVRRNSAISIFNSLSSAKRILIPSIDTSSSWLSACFISAKIRNGSCTMNTLHFYFCQFYFRYSFRNGHKKRHRFSIPMACK